MHRVLIHARRFLTSEEGPTTAEYAILLALIIVAAVAAVRLVGVGMNHLYTMILGNLA